VEIVRRIIAAIALGMVLLATVAAAPANAAYAGGDGRLAFVRANQI